MNTAWVYIRSEPHLFTVGFYDPSGKWHSDSDHDSSEDAAQRVAYLNGGPQESPEVAALKAERAELVEALRRLQPLVADYGLGSNPLMSEQTNILHASEEARALLAKLGAAK
jgi:hypothetical protein